MQKYEMTVVFKTALDEEALLAEHNQVISLIERFGGTVEKVDDWGKRRLAYEIEKTNEGIYRFITFAAPSNAPAEIESRMRIRENLLRYLIIKPEQEIPGGKQPKKEATQKGGIA
ncbi:MAG: 30S ribosomal protein S6 [Defluviitaleaceae bacterium]|nr:30S ribosomal protein S6 [Defluviitaleaceae bacterium]